MGSLSDRHGEWKGQQHLRIDSNEPASSVDDTGSKKGDDLELRVRDQDTPTDADTVAGSNDRGRRRRFQFPRLGLDALIRDGQPEDDGRQDGSVAFYKVYKRRWFGLVELTLLTLLVSWEVSLLLSFLFSAFSFLLLIPNSRPLSSPSSSVRIEFGCLAYM